MEGIGIGVIVTAFLLGLRHGIDWDHIAAISDITSSQLSIRRALGFSTLYAAGHASMVFVLGVIAIAAGDLLPPGLDGAMERMVGATLVLLGIYVFYSLVRHRRDFQMRSRWMLLIEGVRRLIRLLQRRTDARLVEVSHEHFHDHPHGHDHSLEASEPTIFGSGSGETAVRQMTHTHAHRHVASMPADPFTNYGRLTSFAVGLLHGIGAETASQVLIFLTVVSAGGVPAGITLLIVFLSGLFVSNTAVAIASSFGFLGSARNFKLYAAIGVVTGGVSLVLGSIYLLGLGSIVPPLF